jgi:ketosteroid isomerase-like protein
MAVSPIDSLVDRYLDGLNTGDVDLLLTLFTPDGTVDSPLYGLMPARDFYPALFEDTARSVVTLRTSLVSDDLSTIAFWFDFDWTLADGSPAPFTVVDVAELRDGRISALHILYDTYPVRDAWARRRRSGSS